MIAGTIYDARSEAGPIDRGSEVIVLGGSRTGLIVRAVKDTENVALPNLGEPIVTHEAEIAITTAQQ